MKIVISAVNLTEGGPLKILRDALVAFNDRCDEGHEVIALVHNKNLFVDLPLSFIKFLEYPSIKKSWINRIFFEYFRSYKLSLRLNADIWLSLHDITPNVVAKKQYVYCHNCSPVFKARFKDFIYEPKFFLFSIFYHYLYKINIKKNIAVIVQQKWFGNYLIEKAGAKNYIISRPVTDQIFPDPIYKIRDQITLFYPALPRTFKNFEILLNAFDILNSKRPEDAKKLKLQLTFSKSCNRYSNYLISKFSHLKNVSFCGILSFSEVQYYYKQCDIVIFPSLLETWGLPISEAKEYSKPLILADLPYAHESLGNYKCAKFFNPYSVIDLMSILEDLIDDKDIFEKVNYMEIKESYNWNETVDYLISEV